MTLNVPSCCKMSSSKGCIGNCARKIYSIEEDLLSLNKRKKEKEEKRRKGRKRKESLAQVLSRVVISSTPAIKEPSVAEGALISSTC